MIKTTDYVLWAPFSVEHIKYGCAEQVRLPWVLCCFYTTLQSFTKNGKATRRTMEAAESALQAASWAQLPLEETRRTSANKPPPRHNSHATKYQLSCLNAMDWIIQPMYASLKSDHQHFTEPGAVRKLVLT